MAAPGAIVISVTVAGDDFLRPWGADAGMGVAPNGMLQVSLALLVGTWVLALVRLARTWRDAKPVALREDRPVRRVAA